MSSIPNNAMPRAIARPIHTEVDGSTAKLLLGLALTPPLIGFALGTFAIGRMRTLASELRHKLKSSPGNEAPAVMVDPVEVEKGGELPVPI